MPSATAAPASLRTRVGEVLEPVRASYAAAVEHDLDGAVATMAPDAVVVDRGLGVSTFDRSGLATWLQRAWDAFPDLTFDVLTVQPVGNTVMCALWLTGTHGGELAGLGPTGRPFTLHVVDVSTVRDGVIVKRELFYSFDEAAAQLGLTA